MMEKLKELKTYIEKCEENNARASVESSLQTKPGISGRYVVYRWLQFVAHLMIMVGAILGLNTLTLDFKNQPRSYYAGWLVYLTSWVLTLNMVQALMGAVVLTVGYFRRGTRGKVGYVYGVPVQVAEIYNALYSVALNLAVFSMFGYWELRVGLPKTLTSERKKAMQGYGLSVILMLVDLFVVHFTYKMRTGLYSLGAMLAYFLVTFLHFRFGFHSLDDAAPTIKGQLDSYLTVKKKSYIYMGLNWAKPWAAGYHAVVCLVMLEVLNCSSLWALCQLRRYFVLRNTLEYSEPEQAPSTHQPQQYEMAEEHPEVQHKKKKERRKSR